MDLTTVYLFAIALLAGMATGFFLRGWLDRYRPVRRSNPKISSVLRSLTGQDAEAAISKLSRIISTDSDDIDAYLALGVLLRQNGWFNRVINLHQRLLLRTGLSPEVETDIYHELALDFKAAGLIDRAIETLTQLERRHPLKDRELSLLAVLHEVSGQWDKAYHFSARRHRTPEIRKMMAFYQVNHGLEQQEEGNRKSAWRHYRHALALDRKHPSALMRVAVAYAENGKIRHSVRYFEKLQAVRPDLTGIIADEIEKIITQSENKALEKVYMVLLNNQKQKPRVAVRLISMLIRQNNIEEAVSILREIQVGLLSDEMKLRFWKASVSVSNDPEVISQILHALDATITASRFLCHNCGTIFSHHDWRCPKCAAWDTIRSRSEYEFKDIEES